MTGHDFTALAKAQAEAEDHLACVLAAREEAVGEAAADGVRLSAIAHALGISAPSARATRERAVAPSPTSPGVEPDLDVDPDDEFRWDDEAEEFVENTVVLRDHLAEIADTYGIDDATLDDVVEDVVDPRVWEITVAEASAIEHAAWEAARDPHAGRAELRRLRVWRYYNGLGHTPPTEMIVAAAVAGAYVADVAEAAHTTSEAVREAVREAHRENSATTTADVDDNTSASTTRTDDDAARRAREGILRKLSDGAVHTAGAVRGSLRHGPVRDRFDDALADLLAEGTVAAETTSRGSREVVHLRLADTPRGGD